MSIGFWKEHTGLRFVRTSGTPVLINALFELPVLVRALFELPVLVCALTTNVVVSGCIVFLHAESILYNDSGYPCANRRYYFRFVCPSV